ncbi:MAG: glycogen debranching enzyme N-terminal domain-containing protein [Kiritimatiellae bacterium]|nr:glycogen debranching enzyme N-terminal domain-containing protein [Kiritimatiellia bacterium]
MTTFTQFPAPGDRLLFLAGDVATFELCAHGIVPPGRAFLRTNACGAAVRRRETIAAMDAGRAALALDWADVPMEKVSGGNPGETRWRVRVPLLDAGCFCAKACYIPDGGCGVALWPDGADTKIKVSPAWTAAACSIYCAFPRQFEPRLAAMEHSAGDPRQALELEAMGWTAIPPGGTLRDLEARLDEIVAGEGFRIVQLLPVHPVPTTFARMGRFGSPFAGTDFFAVDPALAQFDEFATPLEQFREFARAVHSRGAKLFLDLPANHTGWASALQNHHPEWFRREPDGRFHSPGAWGVVWADLVELDHVRPRLRDYLASVFEFWCDQGVDGFRCDAGYMIPPETWRYIVARVRNPFPDTVFLLEGLGGKLSVTDALLGDEGLDWAYSEIFQTFDRSDFERYLGDAEARSASLGPLVHFAETHDNARLAARSRRWAKMRTALSALASRQGCWGVTCGVEWFADEKIDVHGAGAMRWGAAENQVPGIRRLNSILERHPAFGPRVEVRMIQRGPGNSLAILRKAENGMAQALVLVNLDPDNPQPVAWSGFDPARAEKIFDTEAGESDAAAMPGADSTVLAPGRVVCFARISGGSPQCEPAGVEAGGEALPEGRLPAAVREQTLRACALRLHRLLCGGLHLAEREDPAAMAEALARDPIAAARTFAGLGDREYLPVTTCRLPRDSSRVVPVPHGNIVLVMAETPFKIRHCEFSGGVFSPTVFSFPMLDGRHAAFLDFRGVASDAPVQAVLELEGDRLPSRLAFQLLPDAAALRPPETTVRPPLFRSDKSLLGLLVNGRGAMSRARAAFGEIGSQYDALLAANLDPHVPCDRVVALARCRAWIVHNGFSTPLDETCQTSFSALPDRLRWRFDAPVGSGRFVKVEAVLRLFRGENRIALEFSRMAATQCDARMLADAEAVRLVVRPDVEARSFHATTKAFTGPERDFPAAVSPRDDGFRFSPQGLAFTLDTTMAGARFVHEPEWHYMVPHPDEAARGQDGSGDLFSPGWFDSSLRGGAAVALVAEAGAPGGAAARATPDFASKCGTGGFDTLESALARSLCAFFAMRDDAPTVIAGFPWFLDWGRDTFIALRGAIAAGMADEAAMVARKFAAFVDRGTLPNMICGNDASNRDTSDAPLWFCTVVADLRERGLKDAGDLEDAVLGILRGYRAGTPNGIRVDADSGLVFSPPHFTWMDTNYPAGTPREGYPVEIQALWIKALGLAVQIDRGGGWATLREKAEKSLVRFFRPSGLGFFSDCLHSPGGFRKACECVADDHLRCNQLFAVTLGAIDPAGEDARAIVSSCEELLVPGAIRTLAPGRVSFALPVRGGDGGLLNDPLSPYWGRYEGDEDTRRKPAYHNGTAWPWPFPSYCEALALVYGDTARAAARSLLASALPLLERGCVGHLPEIVDGDAPHTGRGCDAQAWSASEFLRVAIALGA